MKYRVMAIITMETEEEARDVWDKIRDAWEKASLQEDDGCNLHKCFHDEDPGRECEVIEKLEPTVTPGPTPTPT